jgi:hypothetical protein
LKDGFKHLEMDPDLLQMYKCHTIGEIAKHVIEQNELECVQSMDENNPNNNEGETKSSSDSDDLPPIVARDLKNPIAKSLKDTVQHNPKLNLFLVPHNTDVFKVTLSPKEDCNCIEKVDCVHKWAVKLSLGFTINYKKIARSNLGKLKRNARNNKKTGRKKRGHNPKKNKNTKRTSLTINDPVDALKIPEQEVIEDPVREKQYQTRRIKHNPKLDDSFSDSNTESVHNFDAIGTSSNTVEFPAADASTESIFIVPSVSDFFKSKNTASFFNAVNTSNADTSTDSLFNMPSLSDLVRDKKNDKNSSKIKNEHQTL